MSATAALATVGGKEEVGQIWMLIFLSDVQEIRSRADVFSGVAAFAGPAVLNLTGNGAASIASGELVWRLF